MSCNAFEYCTWFLKHLGKVSQPAKASLVLRNHTLHPESSIISGIQKIQSPFLKYIRKYLKVLWLCLSTLLLDLTKFFTGDDPCGAILRASDSLSPSQRICTTDHPWWRRHSRSQPARPRTFFLPCERRITFPFHFPRRWMATATCWHV